MLQLRKRHRYRVEHTPRSVKRRAIRDGREWRWAFWPPRWPFREKKESLPRTDQQEPATFERTLHEGTEHDMQMIAEQWMALDQKLKTTYCHAHAELKAAERSHVKESQEARRAREEYETARARFFEMDSPALDRGWLLAWLFLIGVGEIPLNSVVFQIFGSGQTETYLMAGLIALILPLAAHWFGKALRQETKTAMDKLLIVAGPLAVLGLLGALASIRAIFFEAQDLEVVLGISMTPTQATILFILINLAVFFTAAVISYEGAHPQAGVYKARQGRLSDARATFAKETGEASAAERRLEAAEKALQRALHVRQKAFSELAERAKVRKEDGEWFIALYRSYNMPSRRDGVVPACFHAPPLSAAIPDALADLDWDCSHSEAPPSHEA